jgi:hypothetical protein
LGRLKVGEAEGGKILVLLGKVGEPRNDDGELGKQDVEAFSQEDQVGVAVYCQTCRRTLIETYSVT